LKSFCLSAAGDRRRGELTDRHLVAKRVTKHPTVRQRRLGGRNGDQKTVSSTIQRNP